VTALEEGGSLAGIGEAVPSPLSWGKKEEGLIGSPDASQDSSASHKDRGGNLIRPSPRKRKRGRGKRDRGG